jgi:hypothetical protein
VTGNARLDRRIGGGETGRHRARPGAGRRALVSATG